METAILAVGLAAGALTTLAFVPQVIRVYRTRSTGDISLPTFLALVLGTVLWLAYGILLGEIPLIAANGVSLGLVSAVLWGKLKYK
ncbi:MAG: SemiSWEET transporter [Pseudomonadota bacterium]